jgi:hypothetical protein
VDEWVYHELLVHPAMVMHPNPKTVFICGGGQSCTQQLVVSHAEACAFMSWQVFLIKQPFQMQLLGSSYYC